MTLSVSIRHGPSPGAAAVTTFTRMLRHAHAHTHTRLGARVCSCGPRQSFSTARVPTPTHGACAHITGADSGRSSSGPPNPPNPPNSGPHESQHHLLQLPLSATRPSYDSRALFSISSASNCVTSTSSFTSSSSPPFCSATTLLSRAQTQTLPLSSPAPRRLFSSASSYPTMTAMKLDGTAIAKKIRERLAGEIAEKQKSNPRFKPCLKIIQGLFQCLPSGCDCTHSG